MDVIQYVIPGLEYLFQEVPQRQTLNSTVKKVEDKADLESDLLPPNLECKPKSFLTSVSNPPSE